MTDLFIPTLHTFAMNNIFTGSCGDFRFRAAPNVVKKTPKEVDMEASSITAEYWHGPLCYKKSQMEGAETFPMSEDGRLAMKAWLEAHI
ncbi:MAG: hypothetical protein J6B67_04845 [Oscillospiraceae bacterium]|nr:hypothetical protein [Oscillospiraceae bacterium]